MLRFLDWLWLEAPFCQERSLDLPWVLESCVAHLSWDLLTDLLRKELGHQSVDLLAHLLWLEITDLFRSINANVHGAIVTLGGTGDKLTIVGGARLEW